MIQKITHDTLGFKRCEKITYNIISFGGYLHGYSNSYINHYTRSYAKYLTHITSLNPTNTLWNKYCYYLFTVDIEAQRGNPSYLRPQSW